MLARRISADLKYLPPGRSGPVVFARRPAPGESAGVDAVWTAFGSARSTDGLVRLDRDRLSPCFAPRRHERLDPICGLRLARGPGRNNREAATAAGVRSSGPVQVAGNAVEQLPQRRPQQLLPAVCFGCATATGQGQSRLVFRLASSFGFHLSGIFSSSLLP